MLFLFCTNKNISNDKKISGGEKFSGIRARPIYRYKYKNDEMKNDD